MAESVVYPLGAEKSRRLACSDVHFFKLESAGCGLESHCFKVKEASVRSSFARVFGVCFAAFVAMPLITTASCASSDEDNSVFTGGTGGKDAAAETGSGATGGSTSGGGTGGTLQGGGGGGTGGTTGGGGTGATGGTTSGGGTGGGTCNPQTCPTPAAPAVKCCVTSNGPCGVDYQQGAGCQQPSTGDN